MDNIIWNKKTYKEFLKYLESNSDSKYKEFHFNLLNDDIELYGVRTPLLKKIAKDISRTNYKEWLKYNNHKTYEEIIIHGLVLGCLKASFKEFLDEFDKFMPFISNWAICDIVCANSKMFKKNLDDGLAYICKKVNSNNFWQQRVGLVLLLNYYINDKYIDLVLKIANNMNSEEYYVKMANAWLISMCYIKYPNKTKIFLNNTKIDNWTYNKSISKICDSKRINDKEKIVLKKLRKH